MRMQQMLDNNLLTIVIQHKFIEISAAWLLAHIRMHHLGSQLFQSNGICQRFAVLMQKLAELLVTFNFLTNLQLCSVNGMSTSPME